MIKSSKIQKTPAEKYIRKYKGYIKNLNLNGPIEKAITDDDFINANQEFYLYYPQLFSAAFDVKKENVALLCIAGYLYYQSTLFLDSVIDEKEFHKSAYVTICQEESIKILTSIYGKDSRFWNYWNQRRNEYYTAIQLEKGIHSREKITIEDYIKIADYKSAFGKAAIDTLFVLNGCKNQEIYECLLKSHELFSVAFQLNDDILDFKGDVLSGQFNWPYYLLKQQPDLEAKDVNILNKYLYIRGVASQTFKIAIDFLDLALSVVEKINVPLWKGMIINLRKKFIISISETDNYLEILRSEVSSSSDYKTDNTISSSIALAVNYLKSKQNADGSWREYVNQGGISDVWSTAFVTAHLSGPLALQHLPGEVSNALAYIHNNKTEKIWGYNTTWVEDADTTNFVFLSYLDNEVNIDKAHVREWNKYLTDKGGFSTYKDKKYLLESLYDKQISDVSGWCNAHPCVSAVGFYFIAKYRRDSSTFSSLEGYFNAFSEQPEYAYWWTSPIYTFYYLVKAYNLLGEQQKVADLTQKVLKYRNDDGSFSDAYGKNDFYTGMGLDIMLCSFDAYQPEIEESVDYLLKNQYEDGSWSNSHTLQIPKPDALTPTDFPYKVATHGTNVRAKEFNRLFTTSIVLKALHHYDRKCSDFKA